MVTTWLLHNWFNPIITSKATLSNIIRNVPVMKFFGISDRKAAQGDSWHTHTRKCTNTYTQTHTRTHTWNTHLETAFQAASAPYGDTYSVPPASAKGCYVSNQFTSFEFKLGGRTRMATDNTKYLGLGSQSWCKRLVIQASPPANCMACIHNVSPLLTCKTRTHAAHT